MVRAYVKAESETHDEVSDRANDALRINGGEINAQVVGEGANLGMTQRGRIEYAQKGGRLNTDAIDNSAGVDTSDHEVNIKILCRQLMEEKALTVESRDKLLRTMTDNVAKLVLKDNYDQPLALSIAEASAASNLAADTRTMVALEKCGLLNRAVEYLPDADELAERTRLNKGLTRPESAVVMAYAKLWLYEELLTTNLPDLPALAAALHEYFPDALQKKYGKAIDKHQLKREIVATQLTNDIINRAGHHIVFDLMEQYGRDAADVTRAYLLVRQSLNIDALWKDIEKLDNSIPTAVQINLFSILRRVVGKAMAALLESGIAFKDMSVAIEHYKLAITQLQSGQGKSDGLMGTHSKKTLALLLEQKVPAELAKRLALLPQLAATLGFVDLAKSSKQPLVKLASIYFAIGENLGFDWLQEEGRAMPASTSWRREALAQTLAEIGATQRRLTERIAARSAKAADNNNGVDAWLDSRTDISCYRQALQEWQTHGRIDQAMLDIANRKLKALAA